MEQGSPESIVTSDLSNIVGSRDEAGSILRKASVSDLVVESLLQSKDEKHFKKSFVDWTGSGNMGF